MPNKKDLKECCRTYSEDEVNKMLEEAYNRGRADATKECKERLIEERMSAYGMGREGL